MVGTRARRLWLIFEEGAVRVSIPACVDAQESLGGYHPPCPPHQSRHVTAQVVKR